MSTESILAFAPYVLAVAAALLSLVSDAFATRRLAVWSAAALLTGAAVAAFVAAWKLAPADLGIIGAGGAFSAGPALVFLAGVISLAGGAAAFESRPQGGAGAALIALGALGAAGAAASTDIVATFLAIETAALAAYALVASARTRPGDEAAMKYFVQGAVAAAIFVLGIAAVLAMGGGTSLAHINAASKLGALPLIGGVVMLIVALSFKAGAFPFHSWVPDAYQSAPAEVSAFIAAGPKLGAVAALGLTGLAIGGSKEVGPIWATLVTVVAVASIVFGNLAALRQTSYTRMLAYSGIGQAGYALLAVAVFAPSAAVIAVGTYALGASAAFLAASAIRRARPTWDGSISGMAGLAAREPVFCAAVAVAMLSLTGLPPLLGFWGKLQAFGTVVGAGKWWLAAIGVLGSVVSFGYYGGVLRSLYFTDAPVEEETCRPGIAGLTTVIVAGAILVIGALPLIIGSQWMVRLFAL
ncbi:MAG: hypothetical protein HY876_08865 [Coriobacteriales bacterium]|nr:hypothetical protein [Coriobacteriales bacterium]